VPINATLAGGVFAAALGPQLIILTKDVWPAYLFVGAYLAQSGYAVLAGGEALVATDSAGSLARLTRRHAILAKIYTVDDGREIVFRPSLT
jgi:hypothetical protein